MRNFTQVITESAANPFSFFTGIFSWLAPGNESASEAERKKIRKQMAEDRKRRNDEIRKKKDDLRAQRLQIKAAIRKNNKNVRHANKLRELDRRLDSLKAEADFIGAFSSNSIIISKDQEHALHRRMEKISNGLGPSDRADWDVAQSIFISSIYKEDEDGNVVLKKDEELKAAIDEMKKNDNLKDVLKRNGLVDDDDNYIEDAEAFNKFASDMGVAVVDAKNAQKDLDDAEDELEMAEKARDTYLEFEKYKKEKDELKSSIGELNDQLIANPSNIVNEILEDDDNTKKLKSEEDVKKVLDKYGLKYEDLKSATDGKDNMAKAVEEFVNSKKTDIDSHKEKIANELKQKLDSVLGDDAPDLEVVKDGLDKDTVEKATSTIDEQIESETEKQSINKLGEEITNEEKYNELKRELKKKVSDKQRELEKQNDLQEEMNEFYKDAQKNKEKDKVLSNEEVKKIHDDVKSEIEDLNPGEVIQDGKVGYYDEEGKFKEKPKTFKDEEEIKKYKEALKVSFLSDPDKVVGSAVEVDVKVDGEGNVTYYKKGDDGEDEKITAEEYKEHLKQNAIHEKNDAYLKSGKDGIKKDLSDAITAAKNGKAKKEHLELLAKTIKSGEDGKLSESSIKLLKGAGIKELGDGSDKDTDDMKALLSNIRSRIEDGDFGQDYKFDDEETHDDDNTQKTDADEGDDEREVAINGKKMKIQNPAKEWHRRKKKNGQGTTKSYYDKKGNSLSADEYDKRMKAYKEANKKNKSSNNTQTNDAPKGQTANDKQSLQISLSDYLKSRIYS
jgi:hypothetical protein